MSIISQSIISQSIISTRVQKMQPSPTLAITAKANELKNIINKIALLYAAISFMFIKSIIATHKGLVIYCIINSILLIVVVYINRKKKQT